MRVVIVSEAAFLTDGELTALTQYVEAGGALYISGTTDPRLAGRLLGLVPEGFTAEHHLLSPTQTGQPYFGEQYTADYPLCFQRKQALVQNPDGHEVLAMLTLPYTLPGTTAALPPSTATPRDLYPAARDDPGPVRKGTGDLVRRQL